MEFGLKDSGTRQSFETGAVRDCQSGKGRFDLISDIALHRLAVVLEKGAGKYGDRNWEKGIPLMRFVDSARRHLSQFVEGDMSEDHAGQALWNLMALVHTEQLVREGKLPATLDNRPDYDQMIREAKAKYGLIGCCGGEPDPPRDSWFQRDLGDEHVG